MNNECFPLFIRVFLFGLKFSLPSVLVWQINSCKYVFFTLRNVSIGKLLHLIFFFCFLFVCFLRSILFVCWESCNYCCLPFLIYYLTFCLGYFWKKNFFLFTTSQLLFVSLSLISVSSLVLSPSSCFRLITYFMHPKSRWFFLTSLVFFFENLAVQPMLAWTLSSCLILLSAGITGTLSSKSCVICSISLSQCFIMRSET